MNKTLFSKIVLGAGFLLGICSYSSAQIGHGGTPYSFRQKSFDSFATVVLPALDNQVLLQEEIATEKKEEGYQFGKEIAVNYRLDNSGSWEKLPDGGRLWRLGIESKGAYSINLIFDDFYIPPSSHLFIYTADQSFVLGSFTSENNNQWGNFATTVLPGDAIVLEFYEAAQDQNKATIHLSTIVHGYKNSFFQKQKAGMYGNSGYCNVNINCEVGIPYNVVKQSVALILNGGKSLCSGTLINNTAQDAKPYFLTAHHCVYKNNVQIKDRDPSQFVFVFNYETADCTGTNSTTNYSIQGVTVVAKGCDTSDFLLLLLNDKPTASFKPYYAGWSRKDILHEGAVAIHHPRGDSKKIAEDRKTLVSGNYNDDKPHYPDNTHYLVVWDTGTTEVGSSGSGLFNREKLLIGQLEGGYADCTYREGEDCFGKFSYSWTNNNHPDSNRLDYWLDPLGLGVESLEGFDPFDPVSVKNIEKQEDIISIYPNPTDGKLKVECGKWNLKHVAVYDIMGRKIIEVTAIENKELVLNVENLHSGLYILKIDTDNERFVRKIVKN